MDTIDREILRRLVTDGRATLQEISDGVGLRRPSVHERVRRLQASGSIRGVHAALDPGTVDASLLAYVFIEIHLGPQGKRDCLTCCEDIAERLRKFPEVLEVHTLAGTEDMVVKLRVKDLSALERLVMREISGLTGVHRVQTKIAMRTHFERPLTVPVARREAAKAPGGN